MSASSLSIVLACSWSLAGTFAASGIGKLLHLEPFKASLPRLLQPLASAVPAAEIVLSVLLIGGIAPFWTGIAVLGILGFFSVYIAFAFPNQRTVSCLCFGTSAVRARTSLLARNAILGICSVGLVVRASSSLLNTYSAATEIGLRASYIAAAIGLGTMLTMAAILIERLDLAVLHNERQEVA